MWEYAYSITDDFGGTPPNFTQLKEEIDAAGITSATYQYHVQDDDDVTFFFDAELTPADKTTLDGVIAAHVPATTTESAQTAKDLDEESTSQTTFQEKLSMTMPPMKRGDYLFSWYCEIAQDGAPGVAAQVTYNGNEQAFSSWGESQYHAFSGSVVATMKEGNTPTIALNYRALGVGSVKIRRARFAVVLLEKEM